MSGFCLFLSLFFLVTCVSGTELHFCFSLLSLTTILLPLGHEGTLFFSSSFPVLPFWCGPGGMLGRFLVFFGQWSVLKKLEPLVGQKGSVRDCE